MWNVAFAQTTSQPPSGTGALVSFLPLILVSVCWYFIYRWNKKKRDKELRKIINEEVHKVLDERRIGRTS